MKKYINISFMSAIVAIACGVFYREFTKVLEIELSKGVSAAISGIAGIAHIMMTAAIVMLFIALRNSHSIARSSQ